MKSYTNRRPPFLQLRQPTSGAYIVLSAEEAAEYGNRFSTLREKVRARAERMFMRDATPKHVKICDEKGQELNLTERKPTAPAEVPKEPPAQAETSGTAKVTWRKRQVERIKRIKFLTRDQVKAFFSQVKDKRDKALFLLMYKRGLRASEPGALLLEDYDRKAGKLYTRCLKGSHSGLHLLQKDEIRALNAWLRERRERRIDSPRLFPGRTGQGLGRLRVFLLFKKYAERAGIPEDKRHPHTLKHSVATHLLEVGADIRDVQELLGHAEIDSTLVYAEITSRRRDRTAREVASKLPNL